MILDERLMLTPTIAVGESANFVTKMFTKVRNGLDKATDLLMNGFNSEDFEAIMANEEKIDSYEDHIGSYLMKLTTEHHLNEDDKRSSSKMLQVIGEFERLGDHASYMAKSAEELRSKNISFSPAAKEELDRILPAVREVYSMAIKCYESGKPEDAMDIGPLRIVISEMCEAFKASHVDRLSDGVCTVEQGFVFNDILYSCGRIADHSMNIAAVVYRFATSDSSNTAYMHDFKQKTGSSSEVSYRKYFEKYMNGAKS